MGHPLDTVLPAAGVDQPEVLPGPLRLVEHPVAGHSGTVLDDRLATTDDAVDQGGLADVRAADDGDDREVALGGEPGGLVLLPGAEGAVLRIAGPGGPPR